MELQSVFKAEHSRPFPYRETVFVKDTRLFPWVLGFSDVEEWLKPKSLGYLRIEKRLMPKLLGSFRTEPRLQPIPLSALATVAHHSFSVVLVLTYPTYTHISLKQENGNR